MNQTSIKFDQSAANPVIAYIPTTEVNSPIYDLIS